MAVFPSLRRRCEDLLFTGAFWLCAIKARLLPRIVPGHAHPAKPLCLRFVLEDGVSFRRMTRNTTLPSTHLAVVCGVEGAGAPGRPRPQLLDLARDLPEQDGHVLGVYKT